ncbi:HTH-type transcriptional regulator MntR [Candidatus Lokiarchaeum ossiferum]|uniref:HTH-type transcriptional regulator MntR n=1 Tax=Candidatus Lokiarchaeum ossiferum TaxID=2951803 RepID=A0ABY6HZ28_9ARCH|nr:HTH-type transcriptional regulator MntR [Candidatus Lokiarchaeum sp. B-35]
MPPTKKGKSEKKEEGSHHVTSYRGVTVRDQEFSESYDEYLEVIYRLSLQNPGGWVKNKEISTRLNVTAPSVTNMLEKLSGAKFIDWKPRSGIRLTEIGRNRAKNLVTYHIVIELFLQRILKMEDVETIDRIACDLEHHLTDDMKNRFIDLLGITENLTNVDNFILEDKIPKHIETRPVYTERELFQILAKIEATIDKETNIEKKQSDKIHSIFASFNRQNQ